MSEKKISVFDRLGANPTNDMVDMDESHSNNEFTEHRENNQMLPSQNTRGRETLSSPSSRKRRRLEGEESCDYQLRKRNKSQDRGVITTSHQDDQYCHRDDRQTADTSKQSHGGYRWSRESNDQTKNTDMFYQRDDKELSSMYDRRHVEYNEELHGARPDKHLKHVQREADERPGCSHWEEKTDVGDDFRRTRRAYVDINKDEDHASKSSTTKRRRNYPSFRTSEGQHKRSRPNQGSLSNQHVWSTPKVPPRKSNQTNFFQDRARIERPEECTKKRSTSQNAPKDQLIRCFSKAYMSRLASQYADEDIAVKLATDTNSLRKMLGMGAMNGDVLEILLQILEKACTGSTYHKSNLKLVLRVLEDSNFFTKLLPQWIKEVKFSAVNEPTVSRICTLCSSILQHFPSLPVIANRVLHVVTCLHTNYHCQLMTSKEYPPNKEILCRLVNLYEWCNSIIYESKSSRKHKAINEFRNIAILPDFAEIRIDVDPILNTSLKKGAYDGVDIYLDTQFRLLREDFVAPLRTGVSSFIKQQQTQNAGKRVDDVRVYRGVHILNPVCGSDGISYRVQFSVRGWSSRQLTSTKLLCYGSLVCLSRDGFVSGIFGVVANRNDLKQGIIDLKFQEPVTDGSMFSKEYIMAESIAFFESYRPVLMGLQQITEDTLPLQNYIIKSMNQISAPLYLQDAPQQKTYDLLSLFKTDCRPSLQTLLKINLAKKKSASEGQSLESRCGDQTESGQKTEDETKQSGADKESGETEDEIPCLSNPREIPVMDFAHWPDTSLVHLDESQLQAVYAALTQELAIIQGPPGTGKTYVGLKIMEILLNNRYVWSAENNGQILVVCYTNHALDQFLEEVLKFEKNVIRIGGRSKSEILKRYNLKNVNMRSTSFTPRKRQKSRLYNLRNFHQSLIDDKVEMACSFKKVIFGLENLKCVMSGEHIRSLQQRTSGDGSVICEWLHQGNICRLYFLHIPGSTDVEDTNAEYITDDENRQLDDELDSYHIKTSGNRRATIARRNNVDLEVLKRLASREKNESLIKELNSTERNLKSNNRMSVCESNHVSNVWNLSMNDRWRLYRSWVDAYRTRCLVDATSYAPSYDEHTRAIKEIDNDKTCEILKGVKVIGMTTTGAAKWQSVLQRVGPRIVVVEEAAEVMEAHVITTLSQNCQHLILIGDHQQLKPNPAVYRLAKKYNLDISLFERMINNDFPRQTLAQQHRMRPEIAAIMRNHFYKDLKDDDSVLGMENIRGVTKNMFFINHEHSEDCENDGMKSHSSEHEAKMAVALCKYLLQQGYSPSQVTILTTYTGQLFSIKLLLDGGCFDGVRVCVVDNYQGEESDIIILSLVRSNDEGKIGFLKTSNRVCVMLSRARMGLFCIGNFKQLAAQSELWKAITDEMRTKQLLGNNLALACPLHPKVETKVACADDFKTVPNGGCMRPCEFRLPCGHVCTRLCHPDSNHKQFICRKQCEKIICRAGHKCQQLCSQQCTKLCDVRVERLVSGCNHSVKMKCSRDPASFKCTEIVLRTDLPCGHQEKMACSDPSDRCPAPCRELLDCGHNCSGKCSSCLGGKLHVSCRLKCSRILVCGHKCLHPCSSHCPPCEEKCENRCGHSTCPLKCWEPCAPCRELCRWRCVHDNKCEKTCSEPCDREPCNMPCKKTIEKCKHPCIGMCGEPCPSKCRICDKKEVTDILFGTEDEDDARFVELEDCKHVIEVTGLDKWMTQNDNLDQEEEEDGELPPEDEQSTVTVQLKSCPRCKTPIRRSTRYNKVIVKMLSDIEKVKAQVSGGLSQHLDHQQKTRNPCTFT